MDKFHYIINKDGLNTESEKLRYSDFAKKDESENTTFNLSNILLTGTTINFEPTNPEFSRFF